jgi:hypothetical protein
MAFSLALQEEKARWVAKLRSKGSVKRRSISVTPRRG